MHAMTPAEEGYVNPIFRGVVFCTLYVDGGFQDCTHQSTHGHIKHGFRPSTIKGEFA